MLGGNFFHFLIIHFKRRWGHVSTVPSVNVTYVLDPLPDTQIDGSLPAPLSGYFFVSFD